MKTNTKTIQPGKPIGKQPTVQSLVVVGERGRRGTATHGIWVLDVDGVIKTPMLIPAYEGLFA